MLHPLLVFFPYLCRKGPKRLLVCPCEPYFPGHRCLLSLTVCKSKWPQAAACLAETDTGSDNNSAVGLRGSKYWSAQALKPRWLALNPSVLIGCPGASQINCSIYIMGRMPVPTSLHCCEDLKSDTSRAHSRYSKHVGCYVCNNTRLYKL